MDSFLHGFKGTPWAKGVVVSQLLSALMNHQDWKITIAHEESVPDEILGWIAWRDSQTIGWICVKGPVQSRGVAHSLLSYIGCDVSREICSAFVTPEALAMAKKKGIKLRFRPYLVA
jgi:hypothetical protein